MPRFNVTFRYRADPFSIGLANFPVEAESAAEALRIAHATVSENRGGNVGKVFDEQVDGVSVSSETKPAPRVRRVVQGLLAFLEED